MLLHNQAHNAGIVSESHFVLFSLQTMDVLALPADPSTGKQATICSFASFIV